MKYLISFEGELYKIITGEEQMQEYVKNYAKELKERGCLNVDQWLDEILTKGFSNVYTYFPEFVIPFDDELIEKN